MSIRARINQLSEQVKAAGLSGKSMTEELAKVASHHDLSADEIDRIAEIANRDVQLGLYKTAQDKRFKFDLARPSEVKKAARKTSESKFESTATSFDKIAQEIGEAGGDPFAAPTRQDEHNSLYDYALSDEQFNKIAADRIELEDRNLLFELDKRRLEYEALRSEGNSFEAKIAMDAVKDHKDLVQSAMDMIQIGMTLPDLFTAIVATVSGSTVSEEDKEQPEKVLRLLIEGLKERGVANYQMGFRHHGDPEALEKMTNDELATRCMAICNYTGDPNQTNTFAMEEVKTASNYFEESTKALSDFRKGEQQNLAEDALKLLSERPSVAAHKIPQFYLDHADNFDAQGNPRVINGSNEFVISVKNLVGEQFRIRQVHAAQEYLGLKLKQIEDAMRKMQEVRNAEEQKIKEQKTKVAPQGIG